MKIGLIGLGIMGKPMAKNILKGGYTDLLVSDLNKAAVDEIVAAGAKAATNPEIGESCDVVMTMLPNSPHVKSVMLGEGGVASYMKSGATFIDMSFMVGGKQEVFDKFKPLLDTMGGSVVRCGDVGAGNTTKLANQIIVACNIQALAEALTLAQKAGVDPQLVFEAIRGGLAGSTVMNAKAPMMIAGNDKPGFKIDLHIKDLNNALDCAHSVGSPVPMTAAVQEILQWLHNHEGGQKDHSAIAQYYEYLTGIQIGR